MNLVAKILEWSGKARAAELAGQPALAATLRRLVEIAADVMAERRAILRTHLGPDVPGTGDPPGGSERH